LELFGEKNRLGRGSNLGQAGGNLCLWGPERFFSTVRNAQYTYPLFGIARFPFFYTQIDHFGPNNHNPYDPQLILSLPKDKKQ
jgi:hypothetical protein